ncbi:MAG: hypothetical protein AAFS07_07655 [Pseudomonadota bacterium]
MFKRLVTAYPERAILAAVALATIAVLAALPALDRGEVEEVGYADPAWERSTIAPREQGEERR